MRRKASWGDLRPQAVFKRLRLRLAWSVFPLRFRLLLGLPFALAKVILLACLALRLTVRFSPDLRARTLAVLAPVA